MTRASPWGALAFAAFLAAGCGNRLPRDFERLPLNQKSRCVVLAFAILGFPCFSAEPPAESQPEPDLVVIAKLVAIEPPRGCGMFHFAEVAEYTDITVFRSVWSSDRLRVVHGCTELPRSQYASGAGTLDRFTVGDYHRLELTMHDIYRTGHRLKGEGNASRADYYALRVDLAPDARRRCPTRRLP